MFMNAEISRNGVPTYTRIAERVARCSGFALPIFRSTTPGIR